jgi:ubiquinone/menaquinone biosynthesis C-methylase UbiE
VKALLDRVHDDLVFQRRVRVLAAALGEMIPKGATVLDVGCGDGQISAEIMRQREGVAIRGIDILLRPKCYIPVTQFDGTTIPYKDAGFDVVMLVDVLHHATDPARLLAEATRVKSKYILIKDHVCKGILARATLRAMDWVGNYSKGVVLPYNYLSESEWSETYRKTNLRPVQSIGKLGLYPTPVNLLFERSLHMATLLESAGK